MDIQGELWNSLIDQKQGAVDWDHRKEQTRKWLLDGGVQEDDTSNIQSSMGFVTCTQSDWKSKGLRRF